jgi:sugar lactone lactonase YvrE
LDKGALSNKREFVRIEEGAGYPDGPTVDAEGCVWTGLFGGWAARRYAPDGVLLTAVPFPVANVTKLALDGTTAYATTAWKGLDAASRAAQPLAGGLFCFDVETPGLPQQVMRHA